MPVSAPPSRKGSVVSAAPRRPLPSSSGSSSVGLQQVPLLGRFANGFIVFWCCSLTLTILDWRNGKSSRPRDPPFTHPVEQSEGSIYERADDHDEDEVSDEEAGHKPYSDNANSYSSPFSDANRLSGAPTNASSNNLSYQSPSAPAFGSQPAGRPSIDAYGAFSDPAPSGFAGGFAAPNQYADDQPRVSRTMQYADPYAAVRASIAGGQAGTTTPPSGGAPPPGYTSYGGYR